MDLLRRDDNTIGPSTDGVMVENVGWVIRAASQSQRCAYLMLACTMALGYEYWLTIPQEVSATLQVAVPLYNLLGAQCDFLAGSSFGWLDCVFLVSRYLLPILSM